MSESKKNLKTGMILFAIAAVLTFGFITLLQFVPVPWFFLALILMHVGILAFIVSKRLLRKTGFNTRTYFKRQYLLLLPYLAVMVYTFACRFGLLVMVSEAKIVFTLVYTGVCLVFTVWNFLSMKKDFNFQLVEHPSAFTPQEESEVC